jgi:hypothetical protein
VLDYDKIGSDDIIGNATIDVCLNNLLIFLYYLKNNLIYVITIINNIININLNYNLTIIYLIIYICLI